MADNTEDGFLNEMKDATNFSAKEFEYGYERISSTAGQINKLFGQTRERINELKTSLADTSPGIVRLGGDLGAVADTISEIAIASRRNVVANKEDVEQMYAAQKILGTSVGELSEKFMDIGVGISQIPEELEKSINYIQSIGGNTKQVMKDVQDNMGQMNRYQFEGGVQGLTKMAAQASMLRFDMGQTFALAEKVLTPEGAIETAAAFQRLGISAGALADPFALMNQSINDPSGLQNSLADVAKQFTYFDEKTKTFKINPQGVLTLKEMETQTGVSAREMSKMGLAAAELDQRLSAIKTAGLTIASEEDKQYLANIATMQDGKYKVTLEDGTKKELAELTQPEFDKLIEQQKTGPKTLEDIARKQMNYSDIISSDVKAIKSAVIGGAVTQKDLLRLSESARSRSTDLTGAASRNFASPEAVRGELTTALGDMKSLYKDIQEGKKKPTDALSDYLKKMGEQGENINSKLLSSFNKSIKEARNKIDVDSQTGLDSMVREGYDKILNELEKNENAAKAKEKNTVYGNKNISSLIEGRQTKDLKESSSTEGAFGSKSQNVTHDGTVNVNVNFTGNGAKDLNSSQMEQVTKAITSTLRSTAFSQTSYNNANPGNPTKAPKEVTV
jgi:hypothetical protein